MFNHITHPISGMAASALAFFSNLNQYFGAGVQILSAILGLIIAVLSAIMTIENFRNRKK
jgi:hypothetical protein|tara:strand:+ start:1809 stop:1988 length:180 start_codon:yes stop_codon:yes gene_type:complete